MGTLHAWQSFGDGAAVRMSLMTCQYTKAYVRGSRISKQLQRDSVVGELGLNCLNKRLFIVPRTRSYASIGAVLMSDKVARGIRNQSGIWKHGHTYQV
jgi:hypothetical protein